MKTTRKLLVTSISTVGAVHQALAKRTLQRKFSPTAPTHEDTSEEKLIDVTTGAQDILVTANTVFPFMLFPDTISMDRQQLTIVHRTFFNTATTVSVQIDDILNVESNVGPFFGSLHLSSKYFVNNVKSIDFLSRSNVIKIQKLIQGYMIAHHREIDCSTIEKDQLIILLNDLGHGTAQ